MKETNKMKLTPLRAWQWSMKKWELFSMNSYTSYNRASCHLEIEHPKSKKLYSRCGFCEKYLDRGYEKDYCGKCPLFNITELPCDSSESLYTKWENNPTSTNAKKMLKAIKACDPRIKND